jgi:hypothetical protein
VVRFQEAGILGEIAKSVKENFSRVAPSFFYDPAISDYTTLAFEDLCVRSQNSQIEARKIASLIASGDLRRN